MNEKYFKEYKKTKNKTIDPEDLALTEVLLPSTKSTLITCNYFIEI